MDKIQLLQSNPYFQGIQAEKLAQFVDQARIFRLHYGDVLVRQGEEGDKAFVVLDGRLRATFLTAGKKTKIIGEVSSGEIVGESAVLLGKPRGATLTALRESLLLEINKQELLDLVGNKQDALLQFTREIVTRTQPTFAYERQVRSVLIFPVTRDVNTAAFANQLAESIQKFKPAKVVTDKRFSHETGISLEGAELNPLTVSPELSRMEEFNEVCLYPSEGTFDNWARICAARVDAVLFVADSRHFSAPYEAEQQLVKFLNSHNQASVELVLIHPSTISRPENTARWLAGRELTRHHHFVENDPKSYAKIARFQTGNAVGLALSGGGFKSSMQAGILHAMQEAEIPLDMVGGSSGGAFAGAVFAGQPDLNKVPALVAEGMEKFNKVMKLTVPVVSLFTGKKLTHGFMDFFGDTGIEDLWTNYFCISLSLVTGEINVHDRGPIWEGVRASSSVMGLFPPVVKNKDCLVDGGFINPCPTDLLEERGAGKIIVVSAFGKAGLEVDAEYPPSVSGWNLLWKKLNPFFKQKIKPGMGGSIVQSMLMASTYLLDNIFDHTKVDLFIEPDVSEYSAQDKDAVQKMYEVGYEYGRKRVDEWKAQLGDI